METEIVKNLEKEMEEVLKRYEWEFNHDVVSHIVKEWSKAKAPLIALLSKHPNWKKGKNYIVFDTDYERNYDPEEIRKFKSWFIDKIIQEEERINTFLETHINVRRSYRRYNCCVVDLFDDLFQSYEIYCNKFQAERINFYFPEMKTKTGQKKTRIINKLNGLLQLNKLPDYNREFAKFCDALSPIKYTRHTIISVNPIDYLLMAHGNSWSSCMTIDVTQKEQNDFHGESANGVFSYMLDSSTFIFYTVDAAFNGEDYELEPKINRMLFHYGNLKLVQARLYPQCNDGANGTQLRERIRNIVQKIVADCLSEPNLWTISHFNNCDKHVYTRQYATHYPDYHYYDRNNITLSVLKTDEKEKRMIQKKRFEIGADAFCIKCGELNRCPYSLLCDDCRHENSNDKNDW